MVFSKGKRNRSTGLLENKIQGAFGAIDEGAWTNGYEHQSLPFILVEVLQEEPQGWTTLGCGAKCPKEAYSSSLMAQRHKPVDIKLN
ncbi:hypothetical protein IEQ34_012368 [Dendrobium chrysotoxum]|uniref:Uncharacterized protein n=1 Tax=Dendrobium chrysotoxum TaxID=161865 RepID=A0AAV7GCR3_DENCH|nr:hypothetical protein IEQ34_012368 [Dendrobium chrysotoxum]